MKAGRNQADEKSSNSNTGEGKNQNTDKNHRDPNNVNQEYLGYNTTYNLANLAIRYVIDVAFIFVVVCCIVYRPILNYI